LSSWKGTTHLVFADPPARSEAQDQAPSWFPAPTLTAVRPTVNLRGGNRSEVQT
jgi:hypothetical protein